MRISVIRELVICLLIVMTVLLAAGCASDGSMGYYGDYYGGGPENHGQ